MKEPTSISPTPPRHFKWPRCGWLHAGTSLKDAEEQVHQAEALYIVASKINHVTTRGPDAYLECYRSCISCAVPSEDFVPIPDRDGPISTKPRVEVVAPELPAFRDLQLNYEQKFEVWAYIARCNEADVPWDTISLDRQLRDLLGDGNGQNG